MAWRGFTPGHPGHSIPSRGCADQGTSPSVKAAQPRFQGLLPHACSWHDGCTERFASKRQLFTHLEEAHGLRRANGRWVSSGSGARARRREARWQFDDFGNPVIQKVFNANAPGQRQAGSRRARSPSLGVGGSDEYVHRRDERGRSRWEPRPSSPAAESASPSHRPIASASQTASSCGQPEQASYSRGADDWAWGSSRRRTPAPSAVDELQL